MNAAGTVTLDPGHSWAAFQTGEQFGKIVDISMERSGGLTRTT